MKGCQIHSIRNNSFLQPSFPSSKPRGVHVGRVGLSVAIWTSRRQPRHSFWIPRRRIICMHRSRSTTWIILNHNAHNNLPFFSGSSTAQKIMIRKNEGLKNVSLFGFQDYLAALWYLYGKKDKRECGWWTSHLTIKVPTTASRSTSRTFPHILLIPHAHIQRQHPPLSPWPK